MEKFAARVTDMHVCPLSEGSSPHVGGPILPPGMTTVLINNLSAARACDMAQCAGGSPDTIITGSATVYIGGLPAARVTDRTAHNGKILTGSPDVIIGGPTIDTGVSVTEEPVADEQDDDLPPPSQPWPQNIDNPWNRGYRFGYTHGYDSNRGRRIWNRFIHGFIGGAQNDMNSGGDRAMRTGGYLAGYWDGCRDREAGRPHLRERS